MKRVVILAFAAVLAGVLIVAGFLVFGADDEPTRSPQEESAIAECREEAADYPGFSEGVASFAADSVTHDGDFYEVRGNAAADNGFGGTKTYRFQCQLKMTPWDRWEVLDLTMI